MVLAFNFLLLSGNGGRRTHITYLCKSSYTIMYHDFITSKILHSTSCSSKTSYQQDPLSQIIYHAAWPLSDGGPHTSYYLVHHMKIEKNLSFSQHSFALHQTEKVLIRNQPPLSYDLLARSPTPSNNRRYFLRRV